jgi:GWxTD domain-containing protein
MIRVPVRAAAAAGVLFLAGSPAGARDLDVRARAVSLPDLDGAPGTLLVVSVPVSGSAFRYYLTAELHGKAGTVSRDWVIDAAADPGARARGAMRHVAVFRFPPGGLRGRITVLDLEADARGEARLETEVPDFGKPGVHLSDLVVGSCAEGGDERAEDAAPWDGTLRLTERSFGDANPDLCVWAQAADTASPDEGARYAVRTRIKNERGKTVLEVPETAERREGSGILQLRPPLESLSQGTYTLEVTVALDDAKASGEARFTIDESRFSPAGDPDELRDILAYVATNRELIDLEQTPGDSLLAFWKRFWKRRDPDPATDANPALAEFLSRLDFATLHFGTLEPGWRTDRGRIYIQYGPPDREEQSGDGSGLPTLLWYYHDRHLTFVFQDAKGLGGYRLIGRRRTEGGL